jgi:hypothetical protein
VVVGLDASEFTEWASEKLLLKELLRSEGVKRRVFIYIGIFERICQSKG